MQIRSYIRFITFSKEGKVLLKERFKKQTETGIIELPTLSTWPIWPEIPLMDCANHISTCMDCITTQSLKEVNYPCCIIDTFHRAFMLVSSSQRLLHSCGSPRFLQSQSVGGRQCNGLTAMLLIVQRRLIGESKELSA